MLSSKHLSPPQSVQKPAKNPRNRHSELDSESKTAGQEIAGKPVWDETVGFRTVCPAFVSGDPLESAALADTLSLLAEHQTWLDYLRDKQMKPGFSRRELAELEAFINNKGYLPSVVSLLNGEPLPYPEIRQLNKLGGTKKRTVYIFPDEFNRVLKLLAWLLYRFDSRQPEGCYSFRRGLGAHTAVRRLLATPNIAELWAYKTDISDYFNSIDIDKLLPIISDCLYDDVRLAGFFAAMLKADAAMADGVLLNMKRGAMAGTPTAPFLANIYLGELDRHFCDLGIPYARYSDDLIVFAKTKRELDEHVGYIKNMLVKYGLSINDSKERVSAPGVAWEFLGFACVAGAVELAGATIAKIKGKIRRKARALRRWMLRKDASPERAMSAMLRSINRKFFEGDGRHELTWSRWFFPLLTRDDGLRQIDAYLQQEVRTIATGRHSKANYRVTYNDLKRLGYRSLVHEYYRYKAQGAQETFAVDGGGSIKAPG
jgi:hypothetical protein